MMTVTTSSHFHLDIFWDFDECHDWGSRWVSCFEIFRYNVHRKMPVVRTFSSLVAWSRVPPLGLKSGAQPVEPQILYQPPNASELHVRSISAAMITRRLWQSLRTSTGPQKSVTCRKIGTKPYYITTPIFYVNAGTEYFKHPWWSDCKLNGVKHSLWHFGYISTLRLRKFRGCCPMILVQAILRSIHFSLWLKSRDVLKGLTMCRKLWYHIVNSSNTNLLQLLMSDISIPWSLRTS